MSKAPAISVIVPVYNVDKYLPRCLDSILGQSFRDIEVICIDDGSTDRSPLILHDYAQRDLRLRVITQANQGVSAARNAGLDAAQGEWIAFVDSDDEVHSSIWETLMSEAGEEDLICFSAEELGICNGTVHEIQSGYFDVSFQNLRNLEDSDMFKISMTVWDKIFRRSKIEACALRFPLNMRFEDNAFVLNYIGLYRTARFVQQKLYRYFRRDDSFMASTKCQKPGIAFDCIKILEPVYNFWKRHGLFPKKQALFERVCFTRLREAIDMCPPWERTGIAFAMTESLRRWDFLPERQELLALREGQLSIYLAPFARKEITMLKPLKGWQKIFYMGNCQGCKIIRIFTYKVLSW